jgi:hypothetical protein
MKVYRKNNTEQVCAFDEDASQSKMESDDDSEYDSLLPPVVYTQ